MGRMATGAGREVSRPMPSQARRRSPLASSDGMPEACTLARRLAGDQDARLGMGLQYRARAVGQVRGAELVRPHAVSRAPSGSPGITV